MPIHDWTLVDAGMFHNFHQHWTVHLCSALNAGVLPEGYYAMTDQRVAGPEPDVVSLRLDLPGQPQPDGGVVTVADAPPRLRQARRQTTAAGYAIKANRISIRNRLGRVVSLIEVVSPGNKESQHAIRSFLNKVVEFLCAGIHVLLIDVLPPTPRDPDGLHHLVWARLTGSPFDERPADKPLSVAAYDVGEELGAYVEPLAVGDVLPDAPLFLAAGAYVEAPLEATYRAAFDALPRVLRDLVRPDVP